jgi:hypothetical protein
LSSTKSASKIACGQERKKLSAVCACTKECRDNERIKAEKIAGDLFFVHFMLNPWLLSADDGK